MSRKYVHVSLIYKCHNKSCL